MVEDGDRAVCHRGGHRFPGRFHCPSLRACDSAGRILDPFADKIIICGVFVFLLSVGGSTSKSGVTAWIVVVVLAREMFVTSLRGFLEKQGQDFSAALSGKLKMVLQCAAVPLCLLSMDQEIVGQFDSLIRVRDFLVMAMVVVTVFSGVEYSIRATQMLRRGRSSETPSDDTASS